MDYTTLANVKQVLGASETTDDALLSRLITEASRAMDRYLTGAINSTDYLKLETVSAELGIGRVNKDGNIVYFPKKPAVASVSAFAYRFRPADTWLTVDSAANINVAYGVVAWTGLGVRGAVNVRITYSGGLAAATASLPSDIINVADVLTARFYKEIKAGLGDTVGVADLGSLQYTKALPIRVVEMLKPYKRVTP